MEPHDMAFNLFIFVALIIALAILWDQGGWDDWL